jgi:hypothetical protein
MQIVLEAVDVQDFNPPYDERFLSIDAYRWSDEEPYELVAFIWFKPVFARESICIAHEHVANARPSANGYTWSNEGRYHHWLGQSESDCELRSSDQLPPSIVTRERIATDAMIQILQAEDELVALAISESDPEILRDLSGIWRIEEISVSGVLDDELGFTYFAEFRAPGRGRGPTCTFSISNGEIIVHDVGFWLG